MKQILKILKIGDCLFIGMILIGFFVSLFWIRFRPAEGQYVSIFFGNSELYRLLIFEDQTLSFRGAIGETVVKIDHGKVWIEKAPCPNQICKNMGKISRSGEVLVCIPNKLIIKIEGESERSIDIITM